MIKKICVALFFLNPLLLCASAPEAATPEQLAEIERLKKENAELKKINERNEALIEQRHQEIDKQADELVDSGFAAFLSNIIDTNVQAQNKTKAQDLFAIFELLLKEFFRKQCYKQSIDEALRLRIEKKVVDFIKAHKKHIVEGRNKHQQTALILSAKYQCLPAVKELYTPDVGLETVDIHGKSILDYCTVEHFNRPLVDYIAPKMKLAHQPALIDGLKKAPSIECADTLWLYLNTASKTMIAKQFAKAKIVKFIHIQKEFDTLIRAEKNQDTIDQSAALTPAQLAQEDSKAAAQKRRKEARKLRKEKEAAETLLKEQQKKEREAQELRQLAQQQKDHEDAQVLRKLEAEFTAKKQMNLKKNLFASLKDRYKQKEPERLKKKQDEQKMLAALNTWKQVIADRAEYKKNIAKKMALHWRSRIKDKKEKDLKAHKESIAAVVTHSVQTKTSTELSSHNPMDASADYAAQAARAADHAAANPLERLHIQAVENSIAVLQPLILAMKDLEKKVGKERIQVLKKDMSLRNIATTQESQWVALRQQQLYLINNLVDAAEQLIVCFDSQEELNQASASNHVLQTAFELFKKRSKFYRIGDTVQEMAQKVWSRKKQNSPTKLNLLLTTVRARDLRWRDKLLKEKTDLDAKNERGLTPLYTAVLMQDEPASRFLLKHGASITTSPNIVSVMPDGAIASLIRRKQADSRE